MVGIGVDLSCRDDFCEAVAQQKRNQGHRSHCLHMVAYPGCSAWDGVIDHGSALPAQANFSAMKMTCCKDECTWLRILAVLLGLMLYTTSQLIIVLPAQASFTAVKLICCKR